MPAVRSKKSDRESVKHNPADAPDARPAGSLNLSNYCVELLRLLWVQRLDHRREIFKHNPADAHDARPAGSLNLSNNSVDPAMRAVGSAATPSATEF